MAELFFLVPGLLLLTFAAFALRRSLRISRLVKAIPLMAIDHVSDLQPGFRLAAGTIQTPNPLKSPFHQRDCVYYAYRVEEPGPMAKRLATGKNWTETRLRDATGDIPIEARAALIRPPHESITDLANLDGLPQHQREFLAEAGIEARHLPRFSSLRIVEYTLEPDDPAHVLGTVEQRSDGKVFYRGPHSPLAVSTTRDAGLLPGLRNEFLLFGASTLLFLTFGVLFLVASFA
ncbi:MAG TPA: hypothetical protein VI818_03580 [Candidatus Thermoplasmatota archaeon]|nr:hypothetical protein [Candidatus Thermoplasmatota archaeon]